MLKLSSVTCFIVFLLPLPGFPHTVSIGKEIVRGACALVQETPESNLFIYRQQLNKVRYADGTVDVSAVILPTKPLPDSSPDNAMTVCAKSAAQQLGERKRPTPGPSQEEELRQLINQCLRAKGAPYEATLVILRRSEVACPPVTSQ